MGLAEDAVLAFPAEVGLFPLFGQSVIACGSSAVLDCGADFSAGVVSERTEVGEFTSRERFVFLFLFFFSNPPRDGMWWNRSGIQLIGGGWNAGS